MKIVWKTTVAILAIAVFIPITGWSQSNWNQEYVAATEENENSPAVAVDEDGTAHIIFLNNYWVGKGKKRREIQEICYSNTSGGSLSEPVQITNYETYLHDPSIALDTYGNIHIAVSEVRENRILYINNIGGSFSEPVVVNPNVYLYHPMRTDIDVDATGNAYITAVSFDNGLMYSTNASSSFIDHNLTDELNIGLEIIHSSIDVQNGTVHIAYDGRTDDFEDRYIYYISDDGGGFLPPDLVCSDNPPSYQDPRIVVGSDGSIKIAFVHNTNDGQITKLSTRQPGGNFSTEDIDGSVGWDIDAAICPNNAVAIIMDGYSLLYTDNKSGTFISPELVGDGTSQSKLVVDGDGYAHIVSQVSNESHDVVYYTNDPDFVSETPKMHVLSVDVVTKSKGQKVKGVASVTIVDELDNPVAGTTITGAWSGLTSDYDEFQTETDGTGTTNSDQVKKNVSGYFTFTVTGVIKSGWLYDAAANVEDSDSAPWNMGKRITNDWPEAVPTETELIGNHPNPFNPPTSIKFQLAEPGNVYLQIYNNLGQEVQTLINQSYNTGYHSITWDGKDNFGNPVLSGIYYYRIQAGDFFQMKKMLLLR